MLWLLTALSFAAPLEAHLDGALENGAAARIAALSVDAQTGAMMSARAPLLPSVTAQGTWTHNQFEAIIQIPGSPNQVTITPTDQFDIVGSVRWAILDAASWSRALGAGKDLDRAEAAAEDSTERALLTVAELYHQTRVAQASVDVANRSFEAIDAALSRARIRFSAGAATKADVLRLEAEAARASEARRSAEVERDVATRALTLLTGVFEGPDADATPRAVPTGELNLDDRPDIVAARRQVQAARSQVTAGIAGYLPSVSLFFNERGSNATGFAGQAWSYTTGAQATWALFDGLGREGRITTARAILRQAEIQAELAEDRAHNEVADTRARLSAAEAAVETARVRVEALTEAERLGRITLDAGASTVADWLLTRRDADDARLGLLRAEAQLAIAVERVRYALGEPLLGG
jgi:outer membrane protein TolC